jgi:hypothetical protein
MAIEELHQALISNEVAAPELLDWVLLRMQAGPPLYKIDTPFYV